MANLVEAVRPGSILVCCNVWLSVTQEVLVLRTEILIKFRLKCRLLVSSCSSHSFLCNSYCNRRRFCANIYEFCQPSLLNRHSMILRTKEPFDLSKLHRISFTDLAALAAVFGISTRLFIFWLWYALILPQFLCDSSVELVRRRENDLSMTFSIRWCEIATINRCSGWKMTNPDGTLIERLNVQFSPSINFMVATWREQDRDRYTGCTKLSINTS